MKYVCQACGFVYDEEEGYPDLGIAPGTKFEDLPETLLALGVVLAKTCSPLNNTKDCTEKCSFFITFSSKKSLMVLP